MDESECGLAAFRSATAVSIGGEDKTQRNKSRTYLIYSLASDLWRERRPSCPLTCETADETRRCGLFSAFALSAPPCPLPRPSPLSSFPPKFVKNGFPNL